MSETDGGAEPSVMASAQTICSRIVSAEGFESFNVSPPSDSAGTDTENDFSERENADANERCMSGTVVTFDSHQPIVILIQQDPKTPQTPKPPAKDLEPARCRVPIRGSLVVSVACALLGVWLWAVVAARDQPCDQPLHVWGLVNVTTVPLAIILMLICTSLPNSVGKKAWVNLLRLATFLCAVFQVVWFILGNVWVFQSSADRCCPVLYHVGFGYLMAVYGICGLSCLLSCLGQLAH